MRLSEAVSGSVWITQLLCSLTRRGADELRMICVIMELGVGSMEGSTHAKSPSWGSDSWTGWSSGPLEVEGHLAQRLTSSL